MTEKKENILKAALDLFAQEGFKSTSTSKVATKAGVSEGLIFRHFGNKDGLLAAILEEGHDRLKFLFSDIITENDPQEVINKTLNIARQIAQDSEQSHFWKLQYKLKWETEMYDEAKMEPVELALTNAFEKLGYEEPQKEAKIILLLLDGMATSFFLSKNFDLEGMVDILLVKYRE